MFNDKILKIYNDITKIDNIEIYGNTSIKCITNYVENNINKFSGIIVISDCLFEKVETFLKPEKWLWVIYSNSPIPCGHGVYI